MKRMQVTMMNAALMWMLCSVSALTQVKGSGTTNYIPVWTASGTIGDSIMYQTDSRIGIGTTAPEYALDVDGRINAGSGYAIGETVALTLPGGASLENLALGYTAMAAITTGQENTALGYVTTPYIDTGSGNTATGSEALFSNENNASYNTANGTGALSFSTTANANTAIGAFALDNNNPTDADNNTAIGSSALANADGANSIAIGANAGLNVYGQNDGNLDIGNAGSSSDANIARIGTSGTQTSLFVAGVRGVATGDNNAVPLVIDSNGQLGTVSSSRRFKIDIQDMADASQHLLQLRPVTFRYQKPFADGSMPMQYGLIAEEVAEVYPDLVARSADGQIETVKYQVLNTMLLNQWQRQQAQLEKIREQIARARAMLSATRQISVPESGTR
ncbi:MAG: tail fiber domain-containing protein [Terriglobales bacterium]